MKTEKFPSIEAFDRVVSRQAYMRENEADAYTPEIRLRPKIKMHGTNAAFGVSPSEIWCQGRTERYTEQNNGGGAWGVLIGFAQRVRQRQADLLETTNATIMVYGEWAGSGVQKKDAITQIGRKVFMPFAVMIREPFDADGLTEREVRKRVQVLTAPEQIREILGFEDEALIVLPWAGPEVCFDFSSEEDLEATLSDVNAMSEAAGEVDPFVKEVFGVEGPGEGYVYVPDSSLSPISLELYADVAFKAKASRHRVKISDKAAKIHADLPQDVHDFVETFVTENRMEQMLEERLGGVPEKRRTGDFVAAVIKDVFKESEPERAALGVGDKQISPLIAKKAAAWFLDRATIAYDPQNDF